MKHSQQSNNQNPLEKLQKVLASAGVASRREAERLIDEGSVTVNNELAHIGQRVSPRDKIRVDGQLVKTSEPNLAQAVVGLYHKPAGEICSKKDEQGRPSVYDQLPICPRGRWVMVGRLDINTSGLLLFTNSGELANKLMHPSGEYLRVYKVRVLGEVDQNMIERLKKGVRLPDGKAQFEFIRRAGGKGANQWYEVGLKEGRNRLVRRLFEHFDLKVSRLMRTQFGPYKLNKAQRVGSFVLQKGS